MNRFPDFQNLYTKTARVIQIKFFKIYKLEPPVVGVISRVTENTRGKYSSGSFSTSIKFAKSG